MKAAGWLIGACFVTMVCALTWGFLTGDFWREGAAQMAMPWGVISVIDVYAGGTLFAGWIAARERSVPRTAAWVVAIVVLGNFATSLYALLAWRAAGGDARRYWLGEHAAAQAPQRVPLRNASRSASSWRDS
jgi:hypothetical protein